MPEDWRLNLYCCGGAWANLSLTGDELLAKELPAIPAKLVGGEFGPRGTLALSGDVCN